MATLKASPYVDIALGYSLVGLDANRSRSTVTRLEYLDHRLNTRGQFATSPSQAVVLAAGGMGNAQLLMLPRADGSVPVGNEGGQVGKYLMEHPEFQVGGEIAIDLELDRYWPAANKGRGVHAIVADDDTAREHGLYGCSLQCTRKTTDHHPMARFLAGEAGRPFYYYSITPRAEMLPSPANRVFLTGERDASGFYRLAARCVLDARDFLNVELTLRTLGDTLIRLGKGRVRVNNDRIYKQVWGGGHTMGTTRMGQSALDVGRGRRLPRARIRQPVCRRVVRLPERRRLRQPDVDHRRAGAAPGRQARGEEIARGPGKTVAQSVAGVAGGALLAAGSAAVVWKSERPGAARRSAADWCPGSVRRSRGLDADARRQAAAGAGQPARGAEPVT